VKRPLLRPAAAALTLALAAALALPALALPSDETVLLTGKVDSPAYPGKELSWQYPYSDDYFRRSGELYDHQLAQCTLGLATSAFRAADLDLDRKDEYIRDYLTQAGFGDFSSAEYDTEPTADTIATCIASKTLSDEDGEFLLVACAVSGGGYQDEWLSNFSFGDYVVHDGFFSAAFTVFQRVFDYIDAHAAGGRYKLWMGGYSRAAAVSNMTAVLALSAEQIANEDLYVYTFATPNNAQADQLDMGYDYSNIFNIVGMFDPVPSIPFVEWGYSKLGTTFCLPAQETTPDYARRREPVAEIYEQITGTAYTNNPEANWFIQKVYQMIYDMVRTADSYQNDLEEVIDQAWNNKSSALRLLRALCSALSGNETAGNMLTGELPDANTLLSVFLYDLAVEELGLASSSWNDLNLMMQLFYEHCPEVYISWMMSQDDPAELFVTDLDYRRIFLEKGVEVTVRDEDGVEMDPICVDILGSAKMVTVPACRTYLLELTPAGKKSAQVKAVEYSAGSLHYAYRLYELSPGQSYTLTLPMEYWSAADDGGVTDAAGNKILPTVQALKREEVHPSAVFELSDSGWMASHFLAVALAVVIVLLLAAIAVIVALVLALRRRGKKKGAADSVPTPTE